MNISEEVLTVLKESKIESNNLFLPNRQLERDLYTKVNKVLLAAGGKWDRKSKSHVFTSCPKEKLGLAVETGKIVNPKSELDAYYTPFSVTQKLVGYADIKAGDLVLESSAGIGNIAVELRKAGAQVQCVEINPESCEVLRKLGFDCIEGDFFTKNLSEGVYDKVVINPPFSNRNDIRHVLHSLKFLKPDGILVAVMSPHFTFSNVKEAKEFKRFLEDNGEILEELDGAFKSSGTGVKTVLVRIIKPLS